MMGNVTSEADSTLVPEGSPVCTRAEGYLDKLVGKTVLCASAGDWQTIGVDGD